MQAKVSMVIPCYNKAPYIGKMLQSVCNQLWDNMEVILVNDGSTDGTREIIAEWEPKLRARGYEVVISDQENQGVAVAVRNGMLRMTGAYFCTVDCDDELDPKYASTMAGWLEKHQEFEWASCECVYVINGKRIPARLSFAATPDMPGMLENYMFQRINTSSCLYVVRRSYLSECGLPEKYPATPAMTQEPQLIVPLAGHGGRIKHFADELYVYNLDASEQSTVRVREPERMRAYFEQYYGLIREMISLLNADARVKAGHLALTRLAELRNLLLPAERTDPLHEYGQSWMAEASDILNARFSLPDPISPEQIALLGTASFFDSMNLWMIGKRPDSKIPRAPRGKVIGYGAMGKAAKRYLPLLKGLPLMPTILWDRAAPPKAETAGVNLEKPDFDALSPNDTVLLFPKDTTGLREETELMASKKVNILSHSEIREYVYAQCFPQFQTECVRV